MATKTMDLTANREAARRFKERWEALRSVGHKPVIVSKRQHPDQWRRWKAYYHDHGLLASVDLMEDGRTEITAPTLDPFTFDNPQPLDQRKPYRED
jgi:hypothetical protein